MLIDSNREIYYKHIPLMKKQDGKIEVISCRGCAGVGVQNYRKLSEGGYSWDGTKCNKCNGNGTQKILVKDETLHKCPNCNGSGISYYPQRCEACQGKGFVDWIRYARIGKFGGRI